MMIYLDYNATSPLAPKVKQRFCKDEMTFANPSSQHSMGKAALKELHDVEHYLFDRFKLSAKEFDLLYHSGATEGSNTILNLSWGDTLIYSKGDHPCITELAKHLSLKGVKTFELELNRKGQIIGLAEVLKTCADEGGDIWVNLTWMQSETGVVQDMSNFFELKDKYPFKLHIDAVQTVGKISGWSQLNGMADAYTFSGHKFGALKGIGFSFVKKTLKLSPLLFGGGQQRGLRSGTLNINGVLSLKDALEDVDLKEQRLLELKNKVASLIQSHNLELIENTSYNTLCFLHPSKKADELLIHFDLNDLCVSSGPACSSGLAKASPTLLAMGYQDQAKNSIRISLGAANLAQEALLLEYLEKVLAQICDD